MFYYREKGIQIDCYVKNGSITLCGVIGEKGFSKKIPFTEFLVLEEVIEELKKLDGIFSLKKESIKSEKEVAKKMKWIRKPMSGAKCGYDHESNRFIIEQKDGEKQITVKKSWIDNLKTKSLKDYAILLNFSGERYYIVSEDSFKELEENNG